MARFNFDYSPITRNSVISLLFVVEVALGISSHMYLFFLLICSSGLYSFTRGGLNTWRYPCNRQRYLSYPIFPMLFAQHRFPRHRRGLAGETMHTITGPSQEYTAE
jgi:hypothetical protein